MAQVDDDGPSWFHDLDPLDTLFLGTAWPQNFRDEFEFSNARTGWLRLVRETGHWKDIERFVREAVIASEEHELAVDDGELMLLLAGRLESIGLDRRKLPSGLLPRAALSGTRLIDGPSTEIPLPEAPADSAQRVANFWESTQVELDQDGTVIDALREGISLFRNFGLPVHEEAFLLLPALYFALVANESEDIEEAGPRSLAWALALPADSALVPVTDLLIAAPHQRLTTNETLSRLFAIPAFAEVASATDKKWTSSPGHALVSIAFELGITQVKTRDGKVVSINRNAAAALRAQVRLFEEKFGRSPMPDEPIFFDPEEDEPKFRSLDKIHSATATLPEELGLSPAWAFAYRETGSLLPRLDGTFPTERDASDWDDAIDQYVEEHGAEYPDFDENMSILRTHFMAAEIHSAARDPEHGRELAAILEEGGSEAVLRSTLLQLGQQLHEILRSDSAVLRTASELARAWNGNELHDRVTSLAQTPVGKALDDAPALLATAAAIAVLQGAPEGE